MSLLSAVERAVQARKAEQAKINDAIQLYRDILQTLTPQRKTDSEESNCADDAATDTSPGEKEDIELLERALEKALRVRTGTGPSKKFPDTNQQSAHRKEPGTTVIKSTISQGNQTSARSASKSAGLDRKEYKKPGTSVSFTLGSKSLASYDPGQCKAAINRNVIQNGPVSSARNSQQAVSASGSLGQGQLQASTLHSKNKTIRSNMLSGNDLGRATPHAEESGGRSIPQQNRIASDQTAKWKSLRSKQNRLWDKVVALQRKPVPGRSHFMERMRATFPKDWPPGCPDQTRALVHRLTHRGLDLMQHYQTREPLAEQAQEAATELGDKKNNYDSLTPERLQMTTAELQNFAEQTKQEWGAWARWRPEGGCLCPAGENGVWGDGMIAHLPPTITYTTEAQLRELEKLRMRVALLQQDICLEQALLDTLSPQLSSIVPGPGRPDVSVLRDVYSLLGEGGERFPAIVLDSEPD